ncbi:hypothetical protein [Novosphingobium beihaiensis]|uniref:HNH endonuclease n=1 Tax=Novosphingobium beihaiensis TaxID=2930389 RepID=A0ABT0BMG1_9SPHN|nr:hypothetical protein [Novosphingobium beihaiensis]MCJ2186016.1 hypothetical protein [Novosphingobium beihaiensis]
MAAEDRFKKPVVEMLAKRAGNRCSNPDCRAFTSGPADDTERAVNVGEAAHIYGANPGSARYDVSMESVDRGAITNGIWLCGNCHKVIDDDPNRYPAGLLFEWQKSHASWVSEQVGKTGAVVRRRYEERHLEEFGKLSYLAERIISEKGDGWEYHLTAEVLRYEMTPVLRRWSALKKGFYMKPPLPVGLREFPDWLSVRMNEAQGIVSAFEGLISGEFERAWGDPGVPGNDRDIVETCRLFGEMCASALLWEEQVRFVSVQDEWQQVAELLRGAAGAIIEEAFKLPEFIEETVNDPVATGTYKLTLVLQLPDQWSENLEAAMAIARDSIIAGIQSGDIDW